MKKENKKKALLAASVAGLLTMASGVVVAPSNAQAGAPGMEHCYGINACKGTGGCGSKVHGHACAGKNGCEGQGFIDVPKGSCLKIKGGRLSE